MPEGSTHYYTTSLVFAGDTIEHTTYSQPQRKGIKRNPQGRAASSTLEGKEANKEKCLRRARTKLRRLILSNVYQYPDSNGRNYEPVFLTLTFAENLREVERAHALLGDFLKRLNYKVHGKKCSELRYIVVPEFQKRGAVHYHVLFFNLPYVQVQELGEVWGHGFIKINAIDAVDNLGAYVCKYLTKDQADVRLDGRKHFWGSRGLLLPTTLTGSAQELATLIAEVLPAYSQVYHAEYENEHAGQIEYTQYRLTSALQSATKRADRRRGRTGRKVQPGRAQEAVSLRARPSCTV